MPDPQRLGEIMEDMQLFKDIEKRRREMGENRPTPESVASDMALKHMWNLVAEIPMGTKKRPVKGKKYDWDYACPHEADWERCICAALDMLEAQCDADHVLANEGEIRSRLRQRLVAWSVGDKTKFSGETSADTARFASEVWDPSSGGADESKS